MAYIGNQIRQYSDRVVLDSLTASATANYTLQLNGSNYVPSSAESLTVSLNGVIQKPQDSYTVSGSTLSFASALTASDSIDFVIAERGITLQTPSAGSVNTEQLASNAVTSAKMFSGFKNGITEADQWRLTANITTNENPISANLERVDNTGAGYLGTGMSVASGVWTFPSTGLWRVEANMVAGVGASDVQTVLHIRQYISAVATDVVNVTVGSNSDYDSASGCFLYNVTDTATHQITFRTSSMVGTTIFGDTDLNYTYFTFTRLGDSV